MQAMHTLSKIAGMFATVLRFSVGICFGQRWCGDCHTSYDILTETDTDCVPTWLVQGTAYGS